MDRPWNKNWILKLKQNPIYGNYRFKQLETGYPPFEIDENIIDTVTREEFVEIEDERIPLFIGCQFGIFPKMNEIQNFYNGTKRFAILSKSLLSGRAHALSIYEVDKDERHFLRYTSHFKVIEFTNWFPSLLLG